MNIKCPKCATLLALKSVPAGGKIKCPKCATILSVGGQVPATPSSQSSTVAPAVPQSPSPRSAAGPTAAAAGGVANFGGSPVSGSPVSGGDVPVRQFYQPTSAVPYVAPTVEKPPVNDPPPAAKPKGETEYEMSMAGKIALAGGVGSLVFLLLLVIVLLLVFGGGGSDEIGTGAIPD